MMTVPCRKRVQTKNVDFSDIASQGVARSMETPVMVMDALSTVQLAIPLGRCFVIVGHTPRVYLVTILMAVRELLDVLYLTS